MNVRDPDTTYNVVVSEADGSMVPQQIKDVECFLAKHHDQFIELLRVVATCCIDFEWDIPDESLGQINRFPASLMKTLSLYNIDIQVSVYRIA